MFDLPNAKRVRRDEMRSPASSRSQSPAPDDDAAQDAYARLGKLLNLNQLDTAQQTASQENDPSQAADNEDEEQEFEFRLFSAPAKSTKDTTEQSEKDTDEKTAEAAEAPTIQKLRIRLHSPTPGSGASTEGRFVKAFRGWDYYFSTPSLQGTRNGEPTTEDESRIAEKKKQFEDVAVSGQHMLTWANSLVWPGCHLPWRVIHLKRHQTKMPRPANSLPVYVVEGAPVSKSPLTRKKPGKKRRVQLRKRVAAAQAAKENEAEKRTRKNRDRKLKRRQKARELKAAAAGVSVEDVAMADGDDHSSDGNE
ncbi:hypothetical protein DTO013E5_6728 [Penicillium roqueforti]|uniref:Uncharacterized protein n=1 Tax=Penicillium roqueforti (strain FM164) TaxID=1365484 RepID=W6QM99_PENRF|nr:uncharacterized protein LCP9604111_6608 [Penicillium roqueforti]CDM35299.1 Protein of unknown function DUF2011 [Penicillium roqueforti FM164]KAF9245936.1 hypothetical protein LCP9604111_6608 [Penicillium roqueforti]KAI1834588.1 hypothetical protein CBS147337_4878 [Penicillium roqueforti]KAI2685886.1 hypothetical protein CBS147355_1373 [Penicillium roqueforti]KAI2692087.1 hypothetical protein LCP963914a_181 [Penicillium roqueforti]